MIAKQIPITLDKPRRMVFDLNTFARYEEATGRFFLDTVSTLFSAFQAEANPLSILKAVSMRDLRALLWASLAAEDSALTVDQVGAMIDLENLTDVFGSFLTGHAENMPDKSEVGETDDRPMSAQPPAHGGAGSGLFLVTT